MRDAMQTETPQETLARLKREVLPYQDKWDRLPARYALEALSLAEHYASAAERLREALDFLVDLKKYKDAHGEDEYYRLRKEKAWIQAREALQCTTPPPCAQADASR